MTPMFDMTIRRQSGDGWKEEVWGCLPLATCMTFKRMYPKNFVAIRERGVEVERTRRSTENHKHVGLAKSARKSKSAVTEQGTYAGVVNKMMEECY